MENTITDRIKSAFNVLLYGENHVRQPTDYGYYYRQDKTRLSVRNEKSIINAICNKIALDVSSITIRHVRLDENDRYIETIDSKLNNCLTVEANLDQTSRSFFQDVVLSMFDEGVVAIVPTFTKGNPYAGDSYDIFALRTGKIVKWLPRYVTVNIYDETTGRRKEITLPKNIVAIVENPLYSVMNEPNSVLQRLIKKLNLLDVVDEQLSSGKLDLIIQLPYIIKSDLRRQQAETRRKDIEEQLTGSKYGIAYTDGSERITQLNRPIENNMMSQIEYLTSMLNSQLGITQSIMDGTADEKTMLNYNNRTIEPIVSAIVDEMKRKFLSKTARTQKQSILFFRDPFKLVPIADLAELGDKFTRNEIISSNEMRQIIGMKPSDDPNADVLKNKNIRSEESIPLEEQRLLEQENEMTGDLNDLDNIDSQINELEGMLNE